MVPLRLFMVLFLLLFSQIGHAQAQTEWPPDPDTIFPPYVTWTRLEREASIPYVEIEGTELLVYLPDGQVERYDLPSSKWQRANMLPDGNVMLLDEWTREYNPDGLILNRETGTFEQPPMVCEDRVLQDRFDPADEWLLIYRDEAFEDGFFCNSSTGEMREGVPPYLYLDTTYDGVAYPTKLELSPDGKSVVVVGVNAARDIEVYAYDFEQDAWTQLGSTGDIPLSPYGVTPCGWVSNTQGFICTYQHISGRDTSIHYYHFDFDNPDKLDLAFRSWGSQTMTVLDDPPRFIAIESTNDDQMRSGSLPLEPSHCTVTIFDEMQGLDQREVGDACIPFFTSDVDRVLYHRHNESLYILGVENADSPVSTLYQITVDPVAGTFFNPILYGEIEGILGTSSDGKYVVVLMGDNEKLDFLSPYDYDLSRFPSGKNWFVTVINSESRQIVYQAYRDSVFGSHQVWWLDDQTLMLITSDSALYRIMFHEQGVDVDITSRYHIQWYDNYMRFRNERYWVYPDDYAVLDFMTFDLMPIVYPQALEKYDISILAGEAVVVTEPNTGAHEVYYISFPSGNSD